MQSVSASELRELLPRHDCKRALASRSLLPSDKESLIAPTSADKIQIDEAICRSKELISVASSFCQTHYSERACLDRFDAKLAVIPSNRFDFYAVPSQRLVAVTVGALRTLLFASMFMPVNDLLAKLDEKLSCANVPSTDSARNHELLSLIYQQFQIHLAVSVTTDRDPPNLTGAIPSELRRSSSEFFIQTIIFIIALELSDKNPA